MVGLEDVHGNLVGATKTPLGFDRVVGQLADDTQIVERVRELGAECRRAGLLKVGRLTQEALGPGVVANLSGLFGLVYERLGLVGIRHEVSGRTVTCRRPF